MIKASSAIPLTMSEEVISIATTGGFTPTPAVTAGTGLLATGPTLSSSTGIVGTGATISTSTGIVPTPTPFTPPIDVKIESKSPESGIVETKKPIDMTTKEPQSSNKTTSKNNWVRPVVAISLGIAALFFAYKAFFASSTATA